MKKKIYLYILLIFVLLCSFTGNPTVGKNYSLHYSSDLTEIMNTIEKLPEAQALFREVQKNGPVKIKLERMDSFDFEALWNSETRTVTVNTLFNKTPGQILTSIIFELHNAKSDPILLDYFHKASNGKINKENYVRGVEKMEHQNAVNACDLLEKGIEKGLFPQDSRWTIFRNFDDHYKLQQVYGHSQWIAAKYDQISPFKERKPFVGTLPNLAKLSPADKQDLAKYLSLKNRAAAPNEKMRMEAVAQITKELGTFTFCEENQGSAICARYQKQKELFSSIFN